MKQSYKLVIAVISTTLLAACGGESATPTPPTGVQQLRHRMASTQEYVYVAEAGFSSVGAYAVDGTTGNLTPLPGSPFSAGLIPQSVAVDPTGGFLYVTNETYGSSDDGSVSAYAINPSNGALTQVNGSPFATGIQPAGIAITPSGAFAYVANNSSHSVSGYAIAGDGSLTPLYGSPYNVGQFPVDIAIDPTGAFLYVTNSVSGTVSAFTINYATGALSEINGSPYEAGPSPFGIAVDPTGPYVYVANQLRNGRIYGFTVNPSNGALTPLSRIFRAGGKTISVTFDPTGQFAYATNFNDSRGLDAYTVNAASGRLKKFKGSPYSGGIGVQGVVVDATSKFVYMASSGNDEIYGYVNSGKKEKLQPMTGSPFATDSGPFGLATCSSNGAACIPPPL